MALLRSKVDPGINSEVAVGGEGEAMVKSEDRRAGGGEKGSARRRQKENRAGTAAETVNLGEKGDRSVSGDVDSSGSMSTAYTTPEIQKIVNFAYVPLAAGLVIGSAMLLYEYAKEHSETETEDYFFRALQLYVLAAVVELTSEPFYVLVQNMMLYQLRVKVEGTAFLVRCVVALGLTYLAYIQNQTDTDGAAGGGKQISISAGVLANAWAQVVYAFVLFFGYIGLFIGKSISLAASAATASCSAQQINYQWRTFIPRWIQGENNNKKKDNASEVPSSYLFDPYLYRVAWTFAGQSLFKHILTEGDKLLMWWLAAAADLGVYSFTSNLGSLVARILFQPVEETSRTFFSRMLSADSYEPNSLLTSLRILTTLLKCHALLALPFLFIAPNYTSTLIDILLGPRWSSHTSAPTVLAVYCAYVPVMGFNGVTEAFLQGVGSRDVLARQSRWMGVFFAIFVAVAVGGVKGLGLGASGIVVANAVNLGLRAAFCWRFVQSCVKGAITRLDAEEAIESDGTNTRAGKSSEAEKEERAERAKLRHDQRTQLRSMRELRQNVFPSWKLVLGFLVAWAVTRWSEDAIGWSNMRSKAMHIG
ncbi:Oligosaccharide translocation protein rft1, partial [Quaeritorhiza haematococci]